MLFDQIQPEDRILIVAPHPDDETIGCGGLMLRFGSQCDVLLLTDGRKGYQTSDSSVDEDALVELRADELRRACELADIHQIYQMDIRDGEVTKNRSRIEKFDVSSYQFVFVPNHYERHPDHNQVAKYIRRMKKQQRATCALYEYEVWSPLPNPTDVLDLSDIMDRKIEMVEQYQSQIKYVDYTAMTVSLNRYRGAGFNTQFAEVYSLVKEEKLIASIYHRLPFAFREKLWQLRHMSK